MVIHHNSPENTKNGDTSKKMSTKGNEKILLLFSCLCIKESKIEEDTRRKRQCSLNQREERKKEGRQKRTKNQRGKNVTTSEHKNKKSKPTKVS